VKKTGTHKKSKVKPSHFNDFFDLKDGVGEHTTKKLDAWIEKALKHQENPLDPRAAEVFDFEKLGMAEMDEEWPDWWLDKKCTECKKGGATLICVWCEDAYYCNGRCKVKNGTQHLSHPDSTCPGPPTADPTADIILAGAQDAGVDTSDADALSAFRSQYEAQWVRSAAPAENSNEEEEVEVTEASRIAAAVARISNEFYDGACDIAEVEDLVFRIQNDMWLELRCRQETEFLVDVIDKMSEEQPRYDPNSVLADDDGGGLDGMPNYGINHHGIPE